VGGLLQEALPVSTLVVAIDPGKVTHRVWLSTGELGRVAEPRTLPVLRTGVDELDRLVRAQQAPAVVFAVEATGGLHQAWVHELSRRFPGSVRLFAPSETTAARAQLGSRRFKTDDRDCAALTYLARQGHGRFVGQQQVEALRAAVRHRRGLAGERKIAQQRLHGQLNTLCPGLSAPVGHGKALAVEGVVGQAVLDCAVAFAGRAPAVRSLRARARGRLTGAEAQYWRQRWRDCLPPPPDAQARAGRLGRSVARWRAVIGDIAALDAEIETLLAVTDGQVLTTLPGVKTVRAAAFAAFTPAPRPFPRRRASLRGDRAGPGPLPVLDTDPTRPDLPPGPGRAPRRADGHRLGPVAELRPVPRA
jgi:transposase